MCRHNVSSFHCKSFFALIVTSYNYVYTLFTLTFHSHFSLSLFTDRVVLEGITHYIYSNYTSVLGKSDRQVEMWPWKEAGANSRSFYTSHGNRLQETNLLGQFGGKFLIAKTRKKSKSM